jgi:hypothetical protein
MLCADFVGPNDRSAVLVTFISAMALAKHQTDRSFQALLEMMKFDDTPSVRAGSVESGLSLFGRVCCRIWLRRLFRMTTGF